MCDTLEAYRSRPARLGERYETHRFESYSIGFIAPGDPSTAVCMAYDTKLSARRYLLSVVQRSLWRDRQMKVCHLSLAWGVCGPHHDGLRFANGAEVALQKLGPGVKGYICNALSSPLWQVENAEAM